MPLLFQLPTAWLVALLSEWLDMPSIGKLDTAMSSKQYRPQFLDRLQNMRSTSIDAFSCLFSYNHQTRGAMKGFWWRWLSIREVHVESIVLRGDAVKSDLVIPSMRNVTLKSFTDDDLRNLVRTCPSLRSLNLFEPGCRGSSRVSHLGFSVLTDLQASLEELSIGMYAVRRRHDGDQIQTAAALTDVLRQCTRLSKVSLIGGTSRFVNFGDLLPFAHLLYELEIVKYLLTGRLSRI